MTAQAVKFKTWNIPWAGRLDPYQIPFKNASVSPFRFEGSISLYGRSKKPLASKTHTTSFILNKGCEADLRTAQDRMLEALLSGPGRLWFDSPSRKGPLVFCENAQPNDIVWTPSRDNWGLAQIEIEWGLDNPIQYRPQNTSLLTTNGYTPVTIADAVFGESGDERVFASFPISASPTNIVINNLGQRPTARIILRLESLGVDGLVNPKILNQETEQFIQYNGTLSTSSHVLQYASAFGAHRARLSTDGGASLVDTPAAGNIWPLTDIDPKQNPYMEFVVGANNLVITADGTPNGRLLVLWLPAYGMV